MVRTCWRKWKCPYIWLHEVGISGSVLMQIENIFLKGGKPALYLAQSCEWCINVPAFVKSCVLKCRNNISDRFFHVYGMYYPQTPPVKCMVIWNSVTSFPELPETIGTTHPLWDVLLEHKDLGAFLPNASQTNSLFCPTSLTSVVCSTLVCSEVWKKNKQCESSPLNAEGVICVSCHKLIKA